MSPSQARKWVRIVRKRSLRWLQGKVVPTDLNPGIARTLNRTLDLLPLDSNLLTKQGGERGNRLNRQLAWSLAFVAGAVNAGGFLAVKSYTSHVTGAASRISDELALGHPTLALGALGILLSFLLGAFTAGLLINLGRRRRFKSHYALSLMIESALLLVFGFTGSKLNQRQEFYLPVTVILLSFIMGMHNAVVTGISNAEVRTTHMTGIVTDIGTELSRLFYLNLTKRKGVDPILANRDRLKLHGLILVSFLVGGISGAIGFKQVGFRVTLIYAAFLFVLAWRPIVYDLRVRLRLQRQAVR